MVLGVIKRKPGQRLAFRVLRASTFTPPAAELAKFIVSFLPVKVMGLVMSSPPLIGA